MIGLAMGMDAQPTDAAFARKLASLYSGTVSVVQPAQLAAMLANSKRPLVLDTRSEREFRVSHIGGAVFMDYESFDGEELNGLDHDRPVVVYCTVGYRSEKIGEKLKKMGFKHVFNLYGGIFEWVNQGHPVVDESGDVTTQVHTYNEDWGKWLQKGEKIYR